MNELASQMRLALPEVTAPALLIYSKQDRTVTLEERHMEQIYAALGSQDKQTLWIENSSHVLTRDAQRQVVFQAAADFIVHISGAGA